VYRVLLGGKSAGVCRWTTHPHLGPILKKQ